ncbi:MAG: LacI family DNA-binding transcriptional regulator [Verrucomicrobiota bacterium JB024]|nr:LacI family DNA-binding transcriptional regulator [Verrucomicrobiota bacterium JB024]
MNKTTPKRKKTSRLPGINARAVTLKDIAASLGVSAMTVSNILQSNPNTKYRQETIERVQREASRMGYQANRSAQAIRRGKTGIIGFVGKSTNQCQKVHDIVSLPFMTGLSQFLIAHSKHVGLVELEELTTAESEVLPPVLRERFFDGLVVGHGLRKPFIKTVADSEVPAIFFDCGVFMPQNCIYRDERYATRKALDRLLEAGHRKIAFRWSKAYWDKIDQDKHKHYSFAVREDAYQKYMIEHGLEPVSLKSDTIEGLVDEIRGTDCTAILLDSHCPFILGALYALNLRVPDDFSLVSIACETNIPVIDLEVSGMGFDRLAAGRQAAEMICKLIDSPEAGQPSIAIKSDWEDKGTLSKPVKRAKASLR